jgi:poly(3-hydroxybutyrate) depolymerase
MSTAPLENFGSSRVTQDDFGQLNHQASLDAYARKPHAHVKPSDSADHKVSSGYLESDHKVAKHRLGSGDHHFNTVVQGQQRDYEMHLPRGYNGTKPVPVFYVMPGVGESIQDMKQDTSLNALSDRKGFAVVYLQAQPKIFGFNSWNLEFGALSGRTSNYDDLAYVKRVHAQVGQMADINSSKQYIIGHSEGGDASQFIARSMPGVFAGVAGIKSTRQLGEPLPRRNDPTAAIFVLGEGDPILPPVGGVFNPLLGIAAPNIFNSRPKEQARAYARANECTSIKQHDDGLNLVTQYNCKQAPVMEIVRHYGGHHWNDWRGQTDTSNRVVNFLLKYEKPQRQV